MAEPYGETVVLRSHVMQGVGVAMVATAVIGIASALTGSGETLARFGAPLLLFGLLGWATFWQPRVEVSAGGVKIVNTFRTVDVPWPAIESVEGRYGLQLRTAYGVFTAWGATAPAGRARRQEADSAAAQEVRRRWESLRTAGWLDDPRLERPRAHRTWHRATLICACVLALAVVVALLVA